MLWLHLIPFCVKSSQLCWCFVAQKLETFRVCAAGFQIFALAMVIKRYTTYQAIIHYFWQQFQLCASFAPKQGNMVKRWIRTPQRAKTSPKDVLEPGLALCTVKCWTCSCKQKIEILYIEEELDIHSLCLWQKTLLVFYDLSPILYFFLHSNWSPKFY